MGEVGNLVILTFHFSIPDHWETEVPKAFPESSFKIIDSHTVSAGCCAGTLFTGGESPHEVCKLMNRLDGISAEKFGQDHVHFQAQGCVLADLFTCVGCMEKHPTELDPRKKIFRLLVNTDNVSRVEDYLNEKNVNILQVSKKNCDEVVVESLPKKHRETLTHALREGYYSFPRRITLRNLAKKMDLAPSTLTTRLQKLETHVMHSIEKENVRTKY